jgi:hypothetical protein
MKGSVFLALATLTAQAVSAVPHRKCLSILRREGSNILSGRDHRHLHERQADLSGSVVTVTQTVVEPSAVIWVDEKGNTISTEIRAVPPATTPIADTSSTIPVVADGEQAVNNPAPISSATVATSTPTGGSGFGICYDMINAQTQCKTADQVDSDFKNLAALGYKHVRTYDIGCDVGIVAQKAAAYNMRLFAGINSVSNVAGDLSKLIGYLQGSWAAVDTINIGNEQVNQGAASAATVIAAVNTGRALLQAAGYTGSVVTVDVFNQFIANPSLASSSDYLAANVSTSNCTYASC